MHKTFCLTLIHIKSAIKGLHKSRNPKRKIGTNGLSLKENDVFMRSYQNVNIIVSDRCDNNLTVNRSGGSQQSVTNSIRQPFPSYTMLVSPTSCSGCC